MTEGNQIITRAIASKGIKEIPLDQIVVGHRFRQDLGTDEQMDELIESIRQNGLFHNLGVKETEDGKYHLIYGGRRYEALKRMKKKVAPCSIYDHDLTQLERNIIELSENIDRKDMTYAEKTNLTKQIHIQMQKLHGSARPGQSAGGHSVRDTARMMNRSIGSVSKDIKLAEAIEQIPGLADCKNQHEAEKLLEKMTRQIAAGERTKEVEGKRAKTGVDRLKKQIADSYILGDLFEFMPTIEKETVDLVELDPPYGIDLNKAKKQDLSSGQEYTEWDRNEYLKMMDKVLKGCHRVMKENSWLLCWFGIDPWFSDMANLIQSIGFEMCEIPALWIKPTGQCQQPETYLANSYETFFYARKGRPEIAKMGRPNYFQYKPVTPDRKISKAEKPIELYEEVLSTFVLADSRVFVPFAGSGNSILAAYNIHCSAFGCDLTKSSRDGFVVRVYEDVPPNYNSYGR